MNGLNACVASTRADSTSSATTAVAFAGSEFASTPTSAARSRRSSRPAETFPGSTVDRRCRSAGRHHLEASPARTCRRDNETHAGDHARGRRPRSEHDRERHRHPQRCAAGRRRAPFSRAALEREQRAVECAPDHEVPGGAVPQPAEHHHDHQIDVGPQSVPCDCRRAAGRGSRAARSRARCASGARTR